jgi:hypothetical protein
MNVYIVAASDAERDPERRLRWGDYWFKDSLGRAIAALGHTVTESVADADVLVNCHGMGLKALPVHTFNVLWIIGHPARITAAECDQYDAVYCESERFTAHLREQGVACEWLPGASDMVPMPDVPKTIRRVFVGNARGGTRPCIDALAGDYEGLQVWGEGWERLPGGVWQGPYIPHDRLNLLYAQACEVLNDEHTDMAEWGFHNPRHYDILAARGEKVPTFAECAERIMGRAHPVHGFDLGCGAKVRRNMVGVDNANGLPHAIAWNLENGLPEGEYDLDVIVADNLLEHLHNTIRLLNDCHDALLPTGRMHITVPNVLASPEAAWSDPTHVRAFTPATFDYFNGAHPRWQEYGRQYGILPWRIVYIRERDRFLDVMLRPVQEPSDG